MKTEDIRRAVEALRSGLLAIVPTDTVYGIAADPSVPGAEERLFHAKRRDRGKPVALLASDVEQVERWGAVLGERERTLASKFWPGPLTLVLPVPDPRLPEGVVRWEGFRIPNFVITLVLLREVGGVLRVTSANRSGEAPALTAEQAVRSLGRYTGAVLDAGAAPGGTPSTVVKVEGGRLHILRQGALAEKDIRAVLPA